MTLGYRFDFSIYSLIHAVLEKVGFTFAQTAAISFFLFFFPSHLHIIPHFIQFIRIVHLLHTVPQLHHRPFLVVSYLGRILFQSYHF
jgi:hypothetical protein